MNLNEIHHGCCLEVLRTMPDNSVDSIVTDPPYGLGKEPDALAMLTDWMQGRDYVPKGKGGFMGAEWDAFVPQPAVWRECLRVLKPGGHIVAFAGTRTQHLMALGLQIAGFELRDMLAWIYGAGFPKSHNLKNCFCGCGVMEGNYPTTNERSEQTPKHDLRPLPNADVSAALNLANQQREVLQSGVSEQGAYKTMLRAKSEKGIANGAEPSLEGRGNDIQEKGQLRQYSLPEGAEVGATNGPAGRLYNGAPTSNGFNSEAVADPNRSGASHRPQSAQQYPGELGALADERKPQASGVGEVCSGCGKFVAAFDVSGWGTALKPALEPITLARKPLCGTVAANVQQHGTGGLNIDKCRIALGAGETGASVYSGPTGPIGGNGALGGTTRSIDVTGNDKGRWPANLLHDGSPEVLAGFPETGAGGHAKHAAATSSRIFGGFSEVERPARIVTDTGSAARYFYCGKATKQDRDEGNGHPTVKPTAVMRWLCRLITPPGGVILDPFTGSGSTGKAALLEGFQFIGIEREAEYVAIARARLAALHPQLALL